MRAKPAEGGKVKAADDELERLVRESDAEMAALAAKYKALFDAAKARWEAAAVVEADRAGRALAGMVPEDDPRKWRDAEIGRRLVYLRDRAAQLNEWILSAEAKANHKDKPHETSYKSVRETAEAELPDLRRMLRDVQDERQATTKEREQLAESMLAP